jgi:phage terminase large subunit-like protein
MSEESPIRSLVRRLVEAHGERVARLALKLALDKLSIVELAAFSNDWEHVWARPKQRPPEGPWRTWGLQAGRGYGKTLALSHFVNGEVHAGRAMLIGLASPTEQSCIDIQVAGPSGLVATSPPWNKAEWLAGSKQVVWTNGARAFVRSPEAPANVRGVDFHLSWLSEIQSWPTVTGGEALMNFVATTRLGYERIVWDSTGKSRHPLIKELVAQNEAEPELHRITRGAMSENTALSRAFIAEFTRKYPPGTQRYREEFLGEMLPESESALVRQAWIDAWRMAGLLSYVKRVIGVDPAVAGKGRGRDRTGVVQVGQGPDGRIYVLRDDSAKFDTAAAWVDLVLDMYVRDRCDMIALETNKGGELSTALIRMAAANRGLEVVTSKPVYKDPTKVYVKEVYAYGDKADRAAPLAAAYERGQVSHVLGADLSRLEDTLCTYEPGVKNQPSPDDLDALVHATTDLLDLGGTAQQDPASSFVGLGQLHDKLVHGGARVMGAAPVLSPGRNAVTRVSGHSIRYDGSSSLKQGFQNGFGGSRGGGGRI